MNANTLPSGIGELLTLAGRMALGLEMHGVWLRMSQIPAADFRRWLAELDAAERSHCAARAALAAAGGALVAADDALTAWLARARLVVMLARGAAWSQEWLETGFTHGGTNVPKRMAARAEVAAGVAEFLAAHPEFEVAFAGVTAAEGRAVLGRMRAAEAASREARSEAGERKRARDLAERHLRGKMGGVRSLLGASLRGDDARWAAFGLNRPKPEGKKAAASKPAPETVIELPAIHAAPPRVAMVA